MEYREMRELLLKSEALTTKQANEILDLWQNKPRTFHDFLRNRSASVPLEAYDYVDLKDATHYFKVIPYYVPAPEIALKFFRLRDDDINEAFKDIVTWLVFTPERELDVCAWPYLTKDCVSYYSRDFILEIIQDMCYVFDFSRDESGLLYHAMYKKLLEPERSFLAINSFNTDGWYNSELEKDRNTATLYSAMSMHLTGEDTGIEASVRKFIIRYQNDIVEIMAKYREASLKEQGLVLN